jgi:hypothetical protein
MASTREFRPENVTTNMLLPYLPMQNKQRNKCIDKSNKDLTRKEEGQMEAAVSTTRH